MTFRSGLYLGVISGVALTLFLVRLWQPEQQVLKHSEHLLEAVMDRDWDDFEGFIADDYHDQWGHDRATVVERTRAVAHYARGLQINVIGPNVQIENGKGYWRGYISIDGEKNNEVIELMKDHVNKIKTPFELEWKRMSGKPWDWKLVAVRNAELELPAAY